MTKERFDSNRDWWNEKASRWKFYSDKLKKERDELRELLDLVRPRNPEYEPPTPKDANADGVVVAYEYWDAILGHYTWKCVADHPDDFHWWMPTPTGELLERLCGDENDK